MPEIYKSMNYKKVRELQERIKGNKEKMRVEKDYKEKKRLKYLIGIDEFKIKLEKL